MSVTPAPPAPRRDTSTTPLAVLAPNRPTSCVKSCDKPDRARIRSRQQTIQHAFRTGGQSRLGRGPLDFGGLSRTAANYRQDGFANLGNSCYISAVLQALIRLPPFASDLMREGLADLVKQPPGLASTSLWKGLVDVVTAIRGKKAGVVRLEAIKQRMSQRSAQFGGYAQQDAHEFLTDLLDLLEAHDANGGRAVARAPPRPALCVRTPHQRQWAASRNDRPRGPRPGGARALHRADTRAPGAALPGQAQLPVRGGEHAAVRRRLPGGLAEAPALPAPLAGLPRWPLPDEPSHYPAGRSAWCRELGIEGL